MKIGVMGYYGFGNAGDEVILRNLERILAGYQVVPLPLGLNYSSDTIKRLNDFDYLVLGGGGLIRGEPPSPFGTFHLWHRSLQTPLGVLGVGVEHVEPQFREPVEVLLERSSFFVVRDEQSAQILDHPKVTVAPDLTFYRPFDPREPDAAWRGGKDQLLGVNLRPSNPRVNDWVRAVNQLGCPRAAIAFSTHPALGDQEILAGVNAESHHVFDEQRFRELDYVLCTAFHAVVFSIQMGIPVAAINYDAKVMRLMKEAGLERYLLEWDDYEAAEGIIGQLAANREQIGQQMRTFTRQAQGRLAERLLEPLQHIASGSKFGRRSQKPGLSAQPRVSLVVTTAGAATVDIEYTVASCQAQDYDNLEILVVASGADSSEVGPAAFEADRVKRVSASDLERLGTGILSGQFVGYIKPGAALAPDAVRLMLRKLESKPGATQCISGYYLTHNHIIERKVRLHRAADPERPLFYGPWYLVHRDEADQLRQALSGNPALRPDPVKTVYSETTPMFQPASSEESALYRGLLAYSRGQEEAGKAFLANAISSGTGQPWYAAPDLIDLIVRIAKNASAPGGPLGYVEAIERGFPMENEELGPLLKKVKAHLRMTAFFETHPFRKWGDLVRTAARSIWDDPVWLRNRGMWVILLRTLVRPESRRRQAVSQRP